MREGINIFLSGFVHTENMRFRNEALSFKVSKNSLRKTPSRPVLPVPNTSLPSLAMTETPAAGLFVRRFWA